MGARNDTRERMVDGAVALLREQGASAVSVDGVLARAKAPRGSVYHHFPGGRAELLTEALQVTETAVVGLLRPRAGDSPTAVIERFRTFWGAVVDRYGTGVGCPVFSVAVGTATDDPLRRDAARILQTWSEALRQSLQAAGVDPSRAASLATTVLAATEGALALSRVQGDLAPLDAVLADCTRLIEASVTG